MKTLTLLTGQISEIVSVSPGTRITSSGSGYIEWTPGTLSDARNAASWTTWAKGSSAGYMDSARQMCIRATATGSMTVTIAEGEADRVGVNAYWEEDVPVLSTDANGNTVLVGAGGETRLLFNERICSLTNISQAVASGVETVVDFTAVILDTHSLADLAANKVANPVGDGGGFYRVNAWVSFAASDAGTYRSVYLQHEVFAGIFVPVIAVNVEPRSIATQSTIVQLNPPLDDLGGIGSLRLSVRHDAGVNLNITAALEITVFD